MGLLGQGLWRVGAGHLKVRRMLCTSLSSQSLWQAPRPRSGSKQGPGANQELDEGGLPSSRTYRMRRGPLSCVTPAGLRPPRVGGDVNAHCEGSKAQSWGKVLRLGVQNQGTRALSTPLGRSEHSTPAQDSGPRARPQTERLWSEERYPDGRNPSAPQGAGFLESGY